MVVLPSLMTLVQVVLHVFAIGMIYSAFMPIICPFTMLFLIMKRKVDSMQLLLQPPIPVHNQDGLFIGSTDVAVLPLNLVMLSLGIFQFGMVYYLSYKKMYKASAGTFVIFWLTTAAYFIALSCARLPYKKSSILVKALEEGQSLVRRGTERTGLDKVVNEIEEIDLRVSEASITLGQSTKFKDDEVLKVDGTKVEDVTIEIQNRTDHSKCQNAACKPSQCSSNAYCHPALHCYLGCLKPRMDGCQGSGDPVNPCDTKTLQEALDTGCGGGIIIVAEMSAHPDVVIKLSGDKVRKAEKSPEADSVSSSHQTKHTEIQNHLQGTDVMMSQQQSPRAANECQPTEDGAEAEMHAQVITKVDCAQIGDNGDTPPSGAEAEMHAHEDAKDEDAECAGEVCRADCEHIGQGLGLSEDEGGQDLGHSEDENTPLSNLDETRNFKDEVNII